MRFNSTVEPTLSLDQFRSKVVCDGPVWTYPDPRGGRCVVTFERDGGPGRYRFDRAGRVFRDASLAKIESLAWEQLYVMGG